eukprot:20288_1
MGNSTHSKSRSPVNTSNENEENDIVREFSAELNAKELTAFDLRFAKECGKQIEGIYKPLTIIVSFQTVQSMMILDQNILLCQTTTHQETKQWITRTIKKLKDNQLFEQYDGLIFVMLCIAKVKEVNGVKTLQEYHDAKGALKHTDKLRKDISFRVNKMHFHWDTAVQYTVTGTGQRIDPNYNTMHILTQEIKMRMKNEMIIYGYCKQNAEIASSHTILAHILSYYSPMQSIDQYQSKSTAYRNSTIASNISRKRQDRNDPVEYSSAPHQHQNKEITEMAIQEEHLRTEAKPMCLCNGQCGSMVFSLIEYCLDGSIYQMSDYPTAIQQLLSNDDYDVARRSLTRAMSDKYKIKDDLSNISTEQIVNVLHRFQQDGYSNLLHRIANQSCLIPPRVLIDEILQNEGLLISRGHNNKQYALLEMKNEHVILAHKAHQKEIERQKAAEDQAQIDLERERYRMIANEEKQRKENARRKTMYVMIWQSQENDGTWTTYGDQVCKQMEDLNVGASFTFTAENNLAYQITRTDSDQGTQTSTATGVTRKIRRKKQARGNMEGHMSNDEHGDNNVCILCLERKANMFNDPCGHATYCRTCSSIYSHDTCPICRQVITEFKQFIYAGFAQ